MCQSTCQANHSLLLIPSIPNCPASVHSCLLPGDLKLIRRERRLVAEPDGMKHSVVFMLVTQLLCRSLAYTKPQKSPAARVTSILDVLALDRHHRHSRETICEKTDWRKHVMKLIKEVPFTGIFRDLKGETKFEASGLVHVNDTYYVVFDSHRSLGVVNDELEAMSAANFLAGEIGGESQFEGITYVPHTQTFLVVQESHEHPDRVTSTLKPLIEEIILLPNKTSYQSLRTCDLELELTHENKGIESIQFYDAGVKGKFLFALCEGNFCTGGKKGKEPGNGRIIISQLEADQDNESNCKWVPYKTINVPSSANFMDYSGMGFSGERFGIVSQENSALWVGSFDFESMDFRSTGKVYHFPRDNNCDMIYCTVEGLSWIDESRIAVTLDRAKADQPFVCTAKDQSIAIFALPHGS